MITNATRTPAAAFRTGKPRSDGWTGERQAEFLMALVETGLVSEACKSAGMSAASAYALRRSLRGTAFNLGWQAATLMARDLVEDRLLDAALNGIETTTRRELDGTTRRHTLNTGLSMAVLNRLDRRAEALDDLGAAAARTIGAAFDEFLDLVIRDNGKAAELEAFLSVFSDPLAAQVAKARAEREAVQPAKSPQLVEESAVSTRPSAPVTSIPITPEPCACPTERDPALLEAA
jgi:hypothetical protein